MPFIRLPDLAKEVNFWKYAQRRPGGWEPIRRGNLKEDLTEKYKTQSDAWTLKKDESRKELQTVFYQVQPTLGINSSLQQILEQISYQSRQETVTTKPGVRGYLHKADLRQFQLRSSQLSRNGGRVVDKVFSSNILEALLPGKFRLPTS